MKRFADSALAKVLVVTATALTGFVSGWQSTGVGGGLTMAVALGTAAWVAIGHKSDPEERRRLLRR